MEVTPSPKSHNQLVGTPLETSMKKTDKGVVPFTGLALKSATGTDVTSTDVRVWTKVRLCGDGN